MSSCSHHYLVDGLRIQSVKNQDGSAYYQIYKKILDAMNHELPQSRKRLIIVALKKNLVKKPFKWPIPKEKVAFQNFLSKKSGGGRILS